MLDFLFYVAVLLYVAGWVLLIPFSRRPWANFWWAGVILPLLLSGISVFVLIAFWRESSPTLKSIASVNGLGTLFTHDGILIAAFVEILAAGLIIGAWMARKADQARFPPPYVWVSLIATALHTPTGFIVFVIVGAIANRWNDIAVFEEPWQSDSEPVSAAVPTSSRAIVS